MQRAEVILSLLGRKSKENPSFVFQRLYRNFFNPDFYLFAQKKLHIQVSADTIQSTLQKLRNEQYYPQFLSREQSRISDIDRLVQEILYLLLRAIYEPLFLRTTGGVNGDVAVIPFLHKIESLASGAHWVFRGKIRHFFSQMSPSLLLHQLSNKIQDGRLLELIRRFLQAGYIQPPFGSKDQKLAFLLAHIYLQPLDVWMDHFADAYASQGKMKYIRHVDDLLIFVQGPKSMAVECQQKLMAFLDQQYRLELDPEQSQVISLREQLLLFMGYHITRAKNGRLLYLVPQPVLQEKLRPFMKNGRPTHYSARIHLPVPKIISLYHQEISSLYNYYCFAHDVNKKLGKFRYYHFRSLLKTIASKEKCSMQKVIDKYGFTHSKMQRTTIGTTYLTADGQEKWMVYFPYPIRRCHHPIKME
ncbi:reverse transcriptase/maturase family protein [Thermoflavimicrobium dichotomicum]|uniref:Type II intron maturase n=1 Tax=Thermoflavimicrobium dichotomicum TaxID=46223 RepID=A0A1I3KD67_9BACL|nr:reverse transcriptase/maturase family protein [Thermoflavimicrobium dichotomicum]SFI70290.1 Type II intron maturase [Thermoflavimicrobium dichotomicum]